MSTSYLRVSAKEMLHEVHALPSGKKLQTVAVQNTSKTTTAKEQLLCDPRVRETLISFIEDTFKPRKNPFTL